MYASFRFWVPKSTKKHFFGNPKNSQKATPQQTTFLSDVGDFRTQKHQFFGSQNWSPERHFSMVFLGHSFICFFDHFLGKVQKPENLNLQEVLSLRIDLKVRRLGKKHTQTSKHTSKKRRKNKPDHQPRHQFLATSHATSHTTSV